MRSMFLCLLALVFVTDVQAQGRRSRRQQFYEQPTYSQPSQTFQTSAPPITPAVAGQTESQDALHEVNAARASRGLSPFTHDPLLNQAALEAARRRASRLITGHLPESDFTCIPSGGQANAAGCAAWTPDWGWGACCTYDHYTYAGAAWVLGSDGRRYMHLFVR